MKTNILSQRSHVGYFALLALLAGLPASVRAQTSSLTASAQGTQPAADSASKKDEVVKLESFQVTGTHIAGASTFTSPTPVLVIEQDSLVTAAPANLADGLKLLPTISPGYGQTVGGGTGNNAANFLNVLALGTTRTLTLLDGRRYTPSGPTGQIDVNMLPQELVSHVDIVSGGASAAYGSDAVGGVINFVLNKEFTGGKTDFYYGSAQAGGNVETKANVTYGADYLGGRGHFVVSGEYLDSKGVNGDGRPERVTEPSEIPDPANSSNLVRATDIRTPFTTGGLVVIGVGGTAANNAKLSGIMFGPGGVQQSYNYGTLASDVGKTSGFQNGGDGFRVGTSQEIVRPLTRKTLFARTDFKLFDRLSLFLEGSYGGSHMDVQNSPTTHTLTIKSNNAYLAQFAPTLLAQMNSLGVTSLTMNRLTMESGLTMSHVDDQNIRGLFGLTAKVGGWNWETSYQWGSNDLRIPVTNNLITTNMALASDAVLSGGQIICASGAAGCVPFNPFGAGAPSAGAMNYIMGTSQYDNYTVQDVADTNLSGKLFTLPAGQISAAAGAQWRWTKSTTTADALSYAGAYRLANNQPFSASYSILEEFAETQIPVLKETWLTKKLEANLAVRHTHYSTSGDANAWKVGLVWQVSNELRMRASRSRDIRAPNLNELFSAGVQTNGVISDNFPGGTGKTYSGVPNISVGNASLRPEIALSSVAGVVYQPSWFKGFSAALDYYSINIADAIYTTGGATAVQQCDLNPSSPLCAFVTRGSTSADPRAVIQTRTAPVNLNSQVSKGTNLETTYQVPLSSWFTQFEPGSLTARALISYVDQLLLVSPLAPTANQAGNSTTNAASNLNATPRVRGTVSLQHKRGPVATFLQLRYVGRMTWDKTRTLGVNTDFNEVASATYLDGQIGYKFRLVGADMEVYLNVANILDKGLVYCPHTAGATPVPTDQNLFDQVGRMFRVGLKTRF